MRMVLIQGKAMQILAFVWKVPGSREQRENYCYWKKLNKVKELRSLNQNDLTE